MRLLHVSASKSHPHGDHLQRNTIYANSVELKYKVIN